MDFRWQDGERLIRFGPGALDEARELLGDGYTLLTTDRALAQAPALGEAAAAVHRVAPGRVDEVAAGLREEVRGELLVGLGGGRVIDVAKALAAADPHRRAAAVPTTLSAAEMTSLHRHATGVPASTTRVRAAIVLNDPRLSGSQPPPERAASAGNSLAHAVEAPLTPLANPVATMAAQEGARLLTRDLDHRDALALGALLAGYAAGSAGYGLHHVMSQTLVRVAGVGHGPANATLLPHTIEALSRRFPDRIEAFAEALGEDPRSAAERLAEATGATRLRDQDVDRAALERSAEAAEERPELHLTPPPARRDELLEIYAAAW